jgi:predicted DNA-binding WGR domain protein
MPRKTTKKTAKRTAKITKQAKTTAKASVTSRVYMTNNEDDHNKFYEIELIKKGNVYHLKKCWGKIGSLKPRCLSEKVESKKDGLAQMYKLVEGKEKRGYTQ